MNPTSRCYAYWYKKENKRDKVRARKRASSRDLRDVRSDYQGRRY